MRVVPHRNTLIVVTILTVAFFGGAGLGLALAAALAPGSELASAISFLLLPAALILGFNAWLGLAILLLMPQLIAQLLRPGSNRAPINNRQDLVPPGYWVFVPTSTASSLLGGILVGILSVDHSGWLVAFSYGALGTAYGATLCLLARAGYLPFPNSD